MNVDSDVNFHVLMRIYNEYTLLIRKLIELSAYYFEVLHVTKNVLRLKTIAIHIHSQKLTSTIIFCTARKTYLAE